MSSSSAGCLSPIDQASSSSSQSPPQPTALGDDIDPVDRTASLARDQTLLSDDPLADAEDIVTFKRKLKQTPGSRFLSALAGSGQSPRQSTPSPRSGTPVQNGGRGHGHDLNILSGNRDGSNLNTNAKDGTPLDWYVEGPGRRVGYDDLTAIDWIFEYTKERQRLRILYSSANGLLGYVQQFLDASQIWVVLILTGLAAGVFAAGIDVASDWLGDLKTGYCSTGEDGGRFYLNKYFCCYGYDGYAQCRDWVSWSVALHVGSTGGKWFADYFFFVIFSVSISLMQVEALLMPPGCICTLRQRVGQGVCFVCKA